MGIIQEREVARADMNDEFGVTVWQAQWSVDYTTDQARELAAEIVRAADEADRIRMDDVHASTLPSGGYITDEHGNAVL